MDARLSLARAKARHPWVLAGCALLLVAGALIQACSDNKGPSGPTFPAKVVGDAIGGPGGTINIQATVTPGLVERGRRAGVTVFLTSAGGAPLQGRTVVLSSASGRFDQASGVTDPNGTFSTTMLVPCEVVDGAGSITVLVEGKSAVLDGAFSVITATSNSPCPATTPGTPGTGGGAGGTTLSSITVTSSGLADEDGPVAATFTVSRSGGGTSSPLTVSLGISGSATIGSDYNLSGSGVLVVNSTTVNVTISAGATSATVTVTPLADADDPDDPLGPASDAERVVLTINASASYSVGSPSVAAVEICDAGASCP